MKKRSNYIKKLLTNGSGTSVKSFLAFLVAIVGILLLISITAVIWIDVLYNKELKTTLQYYPDDDAKVAKYITTSFYAVKKDAKPELSHDEWECILSGAIIATTSGSINSNHKKLSWV